MNSDRLYHVVVRDSGGREETISCTGEHPFFVVDRQEFIPAKELTTGDRFAQMDGSFAAVVGVQIEIANDEAFTTYNFEVEDDHTYFAGTAGVWVHNAGTICGAALDTLSKRADLGDLLKDPAKLRQAIRESLQPDLDSARRDILQHSDNFSPDGLRWLDLEFAKHEQDVFDSVSRRFSSFSPNVAPNSGKPPLWTATKYKTGVENAFGHFKKHGAEFPEYPNATQYAQGARSFVNNPPAGTLTKIRPNGDKLFYDPAT